MTKLMKRLREMYPTAEIQISWMPGGDTTTIHVDEGGGSRLVGRSHTLIVALQMAVKPVLDMPF